MKLLRPKRRAKRLLVSALFLLAVPSGYTAYELALGQAVQAATPDQAARVTRHYDGDTLTLLGGARVRLLQIDTPEIRGAECYAYRARLELMRLAPPGRKVRLATDPALDERDRYGRLLRYVFAGERNVVVEMVRRGAATPYFYRGERGAYAQDLLEAVAEARSKRRGLWGACKVVYDPERAVTTRPR